MKYFYIFITLIGISSIDALAQNPEFFFNGGADVIFRYPPRGSGGRAIVHDDGNVLTLNYGGDFTGGVRLGNGFHTSNNGQLSFASWAPAGAAQGDFFVDVEPGTRILRTRNWNAVSPNVVATGIHTGTGLFEGSLQVNGKGLFSNNLKIFGSDEAWAEGISIVKLSGWSGLRLTRNDPSTGNYEGNWAIGYSGTTGNDLSISNHSNNTQNDFLLHISSATSNVGIGTSIPDEKLTVKGKIHAEEVRVDLSVPGPDYVFAEDYQLPTLNSIQTYIQENKHLPEVPSAKEMEQNGINLSEMNMLLLKKLEELTLHLINQNKDIEGLKASNQYLTEQVKLLKRY